MKKKKIIYIITISIILMLMAGAIINETIINPKHREISEEKTEFSIAAEDLQFYFANDLFKANKKYINKVLEIKGKVTEVESNTMVMSNRVQIDFSKSPDNLLHVNDNVTIKGRCVGFDELLSLVKIDQATTLNTK